MRNNKTLRDKLLQGVSGNPLFKIALFKAPPTFPTLIDSLRAAVGVKSTYDPGSRVKRHTGTDPNRRCSHISESNVYYSDRKMKFSNGNKRGNRFQPRPSYTSCIICKKMDCYSSRYSDEEQAAFKVRYFAERKAEGIKATNDSFKAYLAYAERDGPDSDQNRKQTENRDSNVYSDDSNTLIENNKLSTDSNNDGSSRTANYTTVFTASNTKYDAREVLKHLEKRKATYVL
ncbi:hypothetical protein DL98DRAFT_533079 [Cadophora sp. DSE1049]|nr:hypothetical protein DL98DRAFT_533079 [Cadophora sp. DSE1049]